MQRNQRQSQFPALRRAFTLVELLVVCAIIAILVTLTVITVNSVAHSTKVAKTRSTIQKLDTAMLQIFASYKSRFDAVRSDVNRDYQALSPEDRQKITAHFIRDLMRMEMPQSWAEVLADPIEMIPGGYSIEESPLLYFYQQEYTRATTAGKTPSRAALLFLIIQNLNPEALEAFHGSEVADTDGDGLLEFVDAWGRPIQFLRWAPAFSDSDLQQNVLKEAKYALTPDQADNRQWWILGRNDENSDLRLAMVKASLDHPDPMDERPGAIGWFLYPLIYSAGADGRYAIDDGMDAVGQGVGSEGILDPFAFPYGMPDGTGRHFDNIHNHQWHR